MTPTEAYRAALEAAINQCVEVRKSDPFRAGHALAAERCAERIRALPVPERLGDADELDRLRAENERLRALATKTQWALQPFADCVFDDNGDLTIFVSHKAMSRDALRDAYFAYKAIRAALKGGE